MILLIVCVYLAFIALLLWAGRNRAKDRERRRGGE